MTVFIAIKVRNSISYFYTQKDYDKNELTMSEKVFESGPTLLLNNNIINVFYCFLKSCRIAKRMGSEKIENI